MNRELITFIRSIYDENFVHLHRPIFSGNEIRYLRECVESNFVSSVGPKVTEFEEAVSKYTGTKHGVATVNGTSALHASLIVAGVKQSDEVITQALTFVATANAISYIGAEPVFVDVDQDTLGMSPISLREWLTKNAVVKNGETFNRNTGRRISACMPMHTFGLPCRIEEILRVAEGFNLPVIEDAAESLGSFVKSKHTGGFGIAGALSFNGNKLITTGGGGMIVTNDDVIGANLKHLTTTAKRPHAYEYYHDEIAYNYRLPNLNAALGVAQMEKLELILKAKSKVANIYREYCAENSINFIEAIEGTTANNWLNAILLNDKAARDSLLNDALDSNVMLRPIWRLISELPMYKKCQHDGLANAFWLVDRVVNLPSSVPELNFGELS